MPRTYSIEGHAIVSANDRIADERGLTPPELRNAADWARFQSLLDGAAVTVLGRKGHEANPNAKGRNRLIFSGSASRIERRSDGWWWNPGEAPFKEALAAAAPHGGIVAIPGGRRVFDLFLEIGYDAFHLSRAEGVVVEAGVPIFTECLAGKRAEEVLADHALQADEPEWLDADAAVTLTIWRRQGSEGLDAAAPAG